MHRVRDEMNEKIAAVPETHGIQFFTFSILCLSFFENSLTNRTHGSMWPDRLEIREPKIREGLPYGALEKTTLFIRSGK